MCPLSTGGRTRCVLLVRGVGGGGDPRRAPGGAPGAGEPVPQSRSEPRSAASARRCAVSHARQPVLTGQVSSLPSY